MKFLSALCIALFTITSFSQSISGQAFYESKTTVKASEIGRSGMDENMKKMIVDRIKSYLEKTYILTFNENESIYKEEEKLETENGRRGGMAMMMGSFSAGNQYKNLKTKQILEEREFFGKQFLINDTIANLEWKLEKDSKQIGQYVAFKATAIKKVDENDLSMARRRNTDTKEKDEKATAEKTTDSTKSDDPFNEIEVPKEIIVTAWYTPMIPVKNGPGEYAGLPGLILELNFYRTTILCSKIVLNPNEAEEIKAPKKGKEVSREEYNKIVKAKTEEMRENFKNGRGRGSGRGGMY
ncbi:MAG: GLPGLI family protein [Flavobacteriaceae bacterium]|jgi:GLPGLI family protein